MVASFDDIRKPTHVRHNRWSSGIESIPYDRFGNSCRDEGQWSKTMDEARAYELKVLVKAVKDGYGELVAQHNSRDMLRKVAEATGQRLVVTGYEFVPKEAKR